MAQTARALPGASKVLPPRCTNANPSLENSLFPPTRNPKVLRTYSKRASKPLFEPPEPFRDTSSKAINTQEAPPLKSDALLPPNQKKRSISDFFRPISTNVRSSSPALSNRQSSPIPSSPQTVPSSPPSLFSADEKENQHSHKKRAPRRLNSRPIFLEYINDTMDNQESKKAGGQQTKNDAAGAVKHNVTFSDPVEIPGVTATANISSNDNNTARAGNNRTESTIAFATGFSSARPGIANLTRPRRGTTFGSFQSAPAPLNTGGVVGNPTVPEINIERPTSPKSIPDGGASRAAYVYDSDSSRYSGEVQTTSNKAGMLSCGRSAFVTVKKRLDVPGSDGDSASSRSVRSFDDISALAMHMSEDGNSRPGSPSATRPRRMTEAEASRQMPMSLGRKERNKPSGIDLDGAGDVRPTRRRKTAISKRKVRIHERPKKVQSTLSLAAHGMTVREPKKCDCSFLRQTYTKKEDAKHVKFHQKWNAPIRLLTSSSSGGRSIRREKVDFPKVDRAEITSIITIVHTDAQVWKTHAEAIIKRAERDTSCLGLTSQVLWSTMPTIASPGTLGNLGINAVTLPRFKVFVGVVNNDVVSVVVAELISQATVVNMVPCDAEGTTTFEDGKGEGIEQHAHDESANIVSATMGIHYMWTHQQYRQCGIASRIVDFARHGGFISGINIQRKDLAWTNLTGDGEKFASRYISYGYVQTGQEWSYNGYASL